MKKRMTFSNLVDVDYSNMEVRVMSERQYTQHDAMKYADKVHDALMSCMRPAPTQLPRSLHSFLCYVNYKNNCYRLRVTPFAYERYMSLIYSDMERVI